MVDDAKRLVVPTVMLPKGFPSNEGNEIYFLYGSRVPHLYILSAQDFRYTDMKRMRTGNVYSGRVMQYRHDDIVSHQKITDDLVQLNDGRLDWSLLVKQHNILYKNKNLKTTLDSDTGGFLTFDEQGTIGVSSGSLQHLVEQLRASPVYHA
ncbi:MAG TPA: hypothetical protein VJK51_05705 [Candidatus Nanoarchaeia archaeon]|nr:hypothetical protein [Candidatus Nanoarchaeia archaeon]